MLDKPISESDKKWRAEQDARTLLEAESIRGDKPRHKMAIGKMAEMAKQKAKEMEAMHEIMKDNYHTKNMGK